MMRIELTKKGIKGILYLTKAPKFAVDIPMENANIMVYTRENNRMG